MQLFKRTISRHFDYQSHVKYLFAYNNCFKLKIRSDNYSLARKTTYFFFLFFFALVFKMQSRIEFARQFIVRCTEKSM